MGTKRPNSKRNLDMAIRRLGRGAVDYLNARTLIANAIVCELMPAGAVKGGSALKMRFGGDTTRATTDLDVARAIDLELFVAEFEKNLAEGWNGFTGRLVRKTPATPDGVPAAYVMQPFEIKLSYNDAPWCTVMFELGFDEIGDADNPDWVAQDEVSGVLKALGFPAVHPAPLMQLHHQIAQKLHAASEEGSTRAHDLIDLQLIVAKGSVDYSKTLATCKRLFAYRGAQAWPPTIVENANWAEIYAEQAAGLEVLPTVAEAVKWANELIVRIDHAC